MTIPMDGLPFLFFFIALVYSMVGFAGGSSYLLVLTLAGFSHTQSAPVALVCNLAVAGIGFCNFLKAGYFRWTLVLPFIVLSVPMAFFGSKIPISKEVFLWFLGISLCFAGLRIFFIRQDLEGSAGTSPARLWKWGLPIGAIFGFFSGLVGIGGGIFLSPFLILTRWASIRQASAAASFFIFINSLSGLVGKMQQGFVLPDNLWVYMIPAFLGGLAGSKLGLSHVSSVNLERVLAVLTLFISVTTLSRLWG